MSNALIEKIRKSRETQCEAGGFMLTIRYPTFSEILSNAESGAAVMRLRDGAGAQSDFDVVLKFIVDHVTGWEGVKEIDLYPGGAPLPAEFSSELFYEWLIDADAGVWGTLYSGIINFSTRISEARENAIKN